MTADGCSKNWYQVEMVTIHLRQHYTPSLQAVLLETDRREVGAHTRLPGHWSLIAYLQAEVVFQVGAPATVSLESPADIAQVCHIQYSVNDLVRHALLSIPFYFLYTKEILNPEHFRTWRNYINVKAFVLCEWHPQKSWCARAIAAATLFAHH